MSNRALLACLVPRRRRLSNGLVLVSRSRDYLLELLLVVALVAVLAAIAINQYRPAVVKTGVVEAASLVRGLQTEILAELAVTGEFPDSVVTTDTLRDGAVGRSYETMAWTDREIVLALKPDAFRNHPVPPDFEASNRLSFRFAFSTAGHALMLCGHALTPPGFGAEGQVETTLPDRYLPHFCRN